MSDSNIRVGKIGNINANNNKGVVNLLAVSQDIQNSISDLALSDANEQANAKELLEKLRKEIEDASELNDKEKERALKQVKSLVETLQMKTQVQTDSGLQERAENAITLIRGIVAGISSAVSIFKVLSEISSLFGIA
ncbi:MULTISPECIES: hypothetical protein [Microcystis]|jgi:hypothetical protein|uniref:Uncharacterized protein n=2 Tax=Microcystis aeruginosa TaxID=1126 RepID=A0A5A5RAU1_MICAE|nr:MULTISPECIES: hypothetical protein [Microcystis]MCZ8247310.1 hypothetical protein [Microcystis sp. LE19-195.1E]QHU84062.1 hypothetical protein D3800_12425 [Microcystis aeruginosa NIES-298]GBD55017.1 hypothetical protein BGM30_41100 [Microcystis aeruginosa NIES-298]GBE96989.1 hypothetical protein NIES298_12380 [Microcystis aeruginosa NIES-298]GCA73140.1 hypothetical protein MiYa_04699 [Microcystis aeruginosa NIES-2519]